MQGYGAADRFETLVMTSANRTSGHPSDCVVPLEPSILLSRDTLELVFQSFSWVATGATGVVNPLYNAIPFQENAGGATVAYVASGNYTTVATQPQYIGTAVAAALTAASPNGHGYTYATLPSQQSEITTGAGTFALLWASGATSGLVAQSQELSYALGYGAPQTAPDTAQAAAQVSPSTQNLSGPSGFLITLKSPAVIPTGVPYSTAGTPASFFVPASNSSWSASFLYNTAPYSGRIYTGKDSATSTINQMGVRIQVQETYPPYPLESTLNDWKMSFILRKAPVGCCACRSAPAPSEAGPLWASEQ